MIKVGEIKIGFEGKEFYACASSLDLLETARFGMKEDSTIQWLDTKDRVVTLTKPELFRLVDVMNEELASRATGEKGFVWQN